jgi:hypothetical protein
MVFQFQYVGFAGKRLDRIERGATVYPFECASALGFEMTPWSCINSKSLSSVPADTIPA